MSTNPEDRNPDERCSNCKWWTRHNPEQGECARYAPSIEAGLSGYRAAERPITPQYWLACGDYVKGEEK